LDERIAELVGPQRYKVWFKNAVEYHITDGYLKIGVPNMFIGSWIENHFSDVIVDATRQVTGRELQLAFTIDPSLSKNLKKRQLDSQVTFMNNNAERMAREQRRQGPTQRTRPLRGKLEDFVVGPSNQLAYSSAMSVIDKPGHQFNPLFIHGGCGLGKTHLLQAIHNGIETRHPDLTSLYLTGEEFMNHFVYSIKSGNRDAFRHRFRGVDVLLIDDIHFLGNKKATQEEFLHTFNALDAARKQLVMASDAHPKLIGSLSESLVNRFVAGMVIKIDSPTLEERVRILQSRAAQINRPIPKDVIEYVASQITSNARELEGALLKLLAFASIAHQPITLALARQALQEHLTKTAPIVRLSDIESVCAIYFGLTPADLHTSRKTRTIALARGISMLLARRHTSMSFPEIGRLMGNKNHSTVILACAKLNKILNRDGEVRWTSAAGDKAAPLRPLIGKLEEQLGLKSDFPRCNSEPAAPMEPVEAEPFEPAEAMVQDALASG
jgi:chromosomal replication initiator protein